jgi:hypothetical protein
MSSWFSEMVQQGGPRALMVLELAGPAVLVSVIHAISPRRWAFWGGAVATTLLLVIGIVGLVEGRSRTDAGVEMMAQDSRTSPADLAEMREAGYQESLRPLQFGGVFAGACAIPLLIGQLRRRRR